MWYKWCLLSLFWVILSSLGKANNPDNPLIELTQAMQTENWKEAELLFDKAILENVSGAEDFYWINLKKDCVIRKTFALELANYYKKRRKYEKAYIFYSEVVQLDPKNIDYLISYAEIEILSGRENEAVTTYERILSLDVNNLPANIFMGNYYFLQAEKKRERLEAKYAEYRSPTRMQYAAYREKFENLLNTEYTKASVYLERVIAIFPSTEIRKTLKTIKDLKIRLENSRDPLLPSRRKLP